jgi:hypothetical protein
MMFMYIMQVLPSANLIKRHCYCIIIGVSTICTGTKTDFLESSVHVTNLKNSLVTSLSVSLSLSCYPHFGAWGIRETLCFISLS